MPKAEEVCQRGSKRADSNVRYYSQPSRRKNEVSFSLCGILFTQNTLESYELPSATQSRIDQPASQRKLDNEHKPLSKD